MKRVVVLTELYSPEETSSGFFVTGIAEGLAGTEEFEVVAICAQPTYSKRGVRAPSSEHLRGVDVRRVGAPKGDKNWLPARLWNVFSLTTRFALRFLFTIRRGDLLLVVTTPPTLPVIVALASYVCSVKPVLLVHDVYPDVLVPTGITKETSLLYRVIAFADRMMLARMSRIVVLGRDMRARMARKLLPEHDDRLEIVPNWGDGDLVHPRLREANPVRRSHQLEGKFVVQFSGNLGRTHGIDDLIELAERLKSRDSVRFLVFGWGAGRASLESAIQERDLSNIVLLPPCSMEELGVHLTACDLFLLPFRQGMEGISVPSRLYNVLAAGNSILAVASSESELAQVVEEEAIGWVASPGDVDAMERLVILAESDSEKLAAMRERARAAYEEKYTRNHVVKRFVKVFQSL